MKKWNEFSGLQFEYFCCDALETITRGLVNQRKGVKIDYDYVVPLCCMKGNRNIAQLVILYLKETTGHVWRVGSGYLYTMRAEGRHNLELGKHGKWELRKEDEVSRKTLLIRPTGSELQVTNGNGINGDLEIDVVHLTLEMINISEE